MEDMFKGFASFIALGVESVAALIIAFGAIEATYAVLRSFVTAQFQAEQERGYGCASPCGFCSALNLNWLPTSFVPRYPRVDRHRTAGSHRGHTDIPELFFGERLGKIRSGFSIRNCFCNQSCGRHINDRVPIQISRYGYVTIWQTSVVP